MKYTNIEFTGIVENNIDPKRKGRIKVRIPGIYDNIPTGHIPWASPQITPTGGSYSIPPLGKSVSVIFDNGDIYLPYYTSTDMYNLNLQDKLDSLSDEDYTNFYAIGFNHNTQIYSDNEKLIIDQLLNKIRIDNDNINLELKDNKRKINIGTKDSDQRAVLGDHFIMDWFKEFLNILVKPTSLVGNMGVPIVKTELDQHILNFLKLPDKYVSKNVFIVDNDKVNKLERDTITNEVGHDDTTIITPNEDNQNGNNVEKSIDIDNNTKENIKKNQSTNLEVIKNMSTDGTTIDTKEYLTPKKNRNIKNKKSKYNHENRERVDRLKSKEVIKRKGEDNTSKSNTNYGLYKKK